MNATACKPTTRFAKPHCQILDHESTDLASILSGEVPWLESAGPFNAGTLSNRDAETDNRIHLTSERPGVILRLDSATWTQGTPTHGPVGLLEKESADGKAA